MQCPWWHICPLANHITETNRCHSVCLPKANHPHISKSPPWWATWLILVWGIPLIYFWSKELKDSIETTSHLPAACCPNAEPRWRHHGQLPSQLGWSWYEQTLGWRCSKAYDYSWGVHAQRVHVETLKLDFDLPRHAWAHKGRGHLHVQLLSVTTTQLKHRIISQRQYLERSESTD